MRLIKKIQIWFRYTTVCLLLPMLFVACGNNGGANILGFFNSANDVQSKEFYEGLLEKFCQDYYDDLYHDFWGTRSYVNGSLKVDSVRQCGEREVVVYGTHDFEGRLGHVYKGRKYSANIYESKKNDHEYLPVSMHLRPSSQALQIFVLVTFCACSLISCSISDHLLSSNSSRKK